jgi:phosphoserine phosphatase
MKALPLNRLNPVAQEFIESIVRLQPHVAAFDCDGTLWAGDAGERFLDWEFREDAIFPDRSQREALGGFWRKRYAAYKRGEVDETTMCGEMVSLHKGIADRTLLNAATLFFDRFFVPQIFPELRELVRRLQENDCDVWAVSSSNEWVIRAGMRYFNIPENRILAASVRIHHGIATGRLIRVPSGPGKTEALREAVGKRVDVAFGNSRWDVEMLESSEHPLAVNPNRDLESHARKQGWPIYFPDGTKH